MQAFKQKCISLRKKGYTLNEITKKLKRSKTSVYFHTRNILLPEEKMIEISSTRSKKMIKYNHTRKGKSRFTFRKFEGWSEKTVCLVAHSLFDGRISDRSIQYNNRNLVLIKKFEECMDCLYDRKPKYIKKADGVRRIDYNNIELANYIRGKINLLLTEIDTLSIKNKRLFLQAFYDDEGCISFHVVKKRREIRGYQYNSNILFIIKKLLSHFGIESKVLVSHNEIIISRKNNLMLFRDKINFSPGIRVNGKRKNSVHKKSIEKRLLLERAINSYQQPHTSSANRSRATSKSRLSRRAS